MHRALCTWAIADTLQELQPYGNDMRTGIIARQVVHGHLVGIPKIEYILFETYHRTDVQGLQELIVQVAVRDPRPIIVLLPVVLPELEVNVGTAPLVTTEHLVIYRWLKLQAALLRAPKGVTGIDLVVQKQVRLGDTNVLINILFQDVVGIETGKEPLVPVQNAHIKIVVGGGPIVQYDRVCDRVVGAIRELAGIDPKIVYVIGNPKREVLLGVVIQDKVVRKRELRPFLQGIPVLVVIERQPHPAAVSDPEIGIERLVVRCSLDADPLRQTVGPQLEVVPYARIGR